MGEASHVYSISLNTMTDALFCPRSRSFLLIIWLKWLAQFWWQIFTQGLMAEYISHWWLQKGKASMGFWNTLVSTATYRICTKLMKAMGQLLILHCTADLLVAVILQKVKWLSSDWQNVTKCTDLNHVICQHFIPERCLQIHTLLMMATVLLSNPNHIPTSIWDWDPCLHLRLGI